MARWLLVPVVFVGFFAAFVLGASCDVRVNPGTVDASLDYGENVGRVTVYGDGAGTSFSENTYVELNCNADAASPGANQDIVKARLGAYSQTLLSYTGYCSYKSSDKDVKYKITATIFPDKTNCNVGSDSYATVLVKASAKTFSDTTCKNGDEVYDPEYKGCVKCGEYGQNKCSDGTCKEGLKPDARGKCTENESNQVISEAACGDLGQKPCKFVAYNTPCANGKKCIYGCMAPYARDDGLGNFNVRVRPESCIPCYEGSEYDNGICVTKANSYKTNKGDTTVEGGDEKELRFALDWKWSLIGVPYGEISSEDHSCISKLYSYNRDKRAYEKVSNLKDKSLVGKGLWAKRPTSGAGGCTIKFTGKYLASQTIELKKGWNLVSVQVQSGIDVTKSSCKITSGPYMYSGFVLNGKPQGYMKRDWLSAGTGYWIKVAEDCKLSTEDDEDVPPAPPQ